MKPLTTKEIKQLKKAADLFAVEAKFIQDGWINLPENGSFVVQTQAEFFKAMLDVMDAVPEVFNQLSTVEAFMLAKMVLTDASSQVGNLLTRRFSYAHSFKVNHDGLWISPWYQKLYTVEQLTEMSIDDIL